MKRVLLVSGGLDSVCAWWVMGKPECLHFGGPNGPARGAALAEAKALDAMCRISPEFAKSLRLADYDFRPFMRDNEWMFPRDQICCIAAWAAGYDSVALGWVAEDSTPYGVAVMRSRLEAAVGLNNFQVEFPVIGMTKSALVDQALSMGCPVDFIKASYSCVRGSTPCGECNNCKKRAEALRGVA